ncbi:pantoate kinase [Salinibacter ruber]|uniref:GHMP family kinase ATP-binding protein n=1 Tax=Salinibacter ruber TaxID=146919 RepID=UPI0016188565|nr:GHMP kinase [Salinibacter ruber]MBB4090593.1 pantoate kinase [Salinibacter ruber]MCS3674775.1 pantoate kinase [Salinibacter ruber]
MSVTAHAPGSVTPIFVPRDGRSSLGISFATADGVTATVESARETLVYLDGRPAQVAPVRGVLERLGVTATVRLDTAVPIGCGFGASGAATLATALAANERMDLGHDREALLEAAHRAEVEAGTGLGDVFIQERGGLVWDVGDGLTHATRSTRIEYQSFGGITTAAVLGDEGTVEQVTAAGRAALSGIDPDGPIADLLKASWQFAQETVLATDRVAEAVASVRAAGGTATMAMIGETVVATGAEGGLDHDTHITPEGAALA